MSERLSAVIADRIVRARLSKGWGQGELSKATGIPQGTISRYESGDREGIHPGNLIKIADSTDVTVDFLVGRTNDPDVAELIKKAMGLKDMTPQDLANATGLSLSVIRRFESNGGRGIDPELLARVAKATGVQVNFLLGIE